MYVLFVEDLTFFSVIEPNAQSRRDVASSADCMDANLVPSWAHILLKVGAALTVSVPTFVPLRGVSLKQVGPMAGSQVYPGGHVGDRAVQK